jgi:hypothetical protein
MYAYFLLKHVHSISYTCPRADGDQGKWVHSGDVMDTIHVR